MQALWRVLLGHKGLAWDVHLCPGVMSPWADKCHQPVPWHLISGRRHHGQAKHPKAELEVARVT